VYSHSIEEERTRLLEIMGRIDQLKPSVGGMSLTEDADGRPKVAFEGSPITLYVNEAWQFWIAHVTTDMRLQCAAPLL
jgi:hypothetical protein